MSDILSGSSGALLGCWSVRRAWQLNCKRFIANRSDIVSAELTDDVTSIGDETSAIQLTSSMAGIPVSRIHSISRAVGYSDNRKRDFDNKGPIILKKIIPNENGKFHVDQRTFRMDHNVPIKKGHETL
ncbi:hypothetical protein T265_05429 [Opisthorchis viverrini]|uniref:Uncharacterized protein n=1 Tax=Opisthorchis viverrini TaxID=6198 RepID=A0A075AFB0_OPIVI|nr:hypothetical protein T265_05429 [Opisthorchis viverrini]KER27539.1 hypothetical protein T265_05429 [Opisthorchis viverrini]